MGEAIVFTSGKGGVGKTTTIANIGAGLSRLDKKVIMLDTDMGLRNLDVVMGIEDQIQYNLIDLLENQCRLKQALIRDKNNPSLFLLPAAQTRDKSSVTPQQMKKLTDDLQEKFDFILLDCPAGIEQGFFNAIAGAKRAIVVTTPEVSAIRDADRIIGLLEANEIDRIDLIINRLRMGMSILLGLWSANETDVSALIFANRQAGAYIAFVTLMIMPMAFIMFVKSFLEINDNLFWKLICYFNVTIILLEHILNATGMYYFRQTLWMTHIVIILMLIYLFVVITIKIIRRQLDTRYKYCILALILVFLSTIIDMAGYYKNGNDSGVFGRIAFLLFILVLGLEASRQAVARLKKGRRIEELEQFALNDSMTGMYNRNAYDYYINNEKCFDDCMVVTFDLNNLKNCNDNYGHRAGDAYIINAARIIENTFERYGKCYRIGGDEFCCIIPKGKSVDIERVIRKLYHDVDVLNNKRIIPTEVGIACGYAVFKVDDTELEKVRERADEEMYQRKKEMKM